MMLFHSRPTLMTIDTSKILLPEDDRLINFIFRIAPERNSSIFLLRFAVKRTQEVTPYWINALFRTQVDCVESKKRASFDAVAAAEAERETDRGFSLWMLLLRMYPIRDSILSYQYFRMNILFGFLYFQKNLLFGCSLQEITK